MLIALLLLSAPIAIADLFQSKIPNIYTKILFYILLVELLFHGIGPVRAILWLTLWLSCGLLLGLGMGDVKLLGVIGLWLNSINKLDFLTLVAFVLTYSGIHLLFISWRFAELPRQIPFAPSILLGVFTYLVA